MKRQWIFAAGGVVVAGAAIFFLVGALLPDSRGPGPEEPPYSAEAIADCFRSLSGNQPVDEESGTEVVSDTHMVIGPDELDADDFQPVPSEYIKVDWVFDAETLDTLQLQLYITDDEAAAAEILPAHIGNSAGGGETAWIENHNYQRGNVVFVWDEGGTEEEREQAHSCLVS